MRTSVPPVLVPLLGEIALTLGSAVGELDGDAANAGAARPDTRATAATAASTAIATAARTRRGRPRRGERRARGATARVCCATRDIKRIQAGRRRAQADDEGAQIG
jgi:hypothetical protein